MVRHPNVGARATVKSMIMFAALVFGSSLHAELPDWPKAKTLPALDLKCWKSFSTAWTSVHPDLTVEGDNLGEPRYQLKSVEGRTLKIIERPDSPEYRKEYGVLALKVFIDPRQRPIYGWWENEHKKSFVLGLDEKTLLVHSITNLQGRLLSHIEVMKCK
jgi:hypothetical protein